MWLTYRAQAWLVVMKEAVRTSHKRLARGISRNGDVVAQRSSRRGRVTRSARGNS